MDPQLLEEIHAAHEAALHARETLERVLDEMNHVGVEWEECQEKAHEAEEEVYQAVVVGRIPMRTVAAIVAQGEELPADMKAHMIHIAGRVSAMRDAAEDAVNAQHEEEMGIALTDALSVAREIENTWAIVRQVAEESLVHGNESNESNGDLSGGRRSLRKQRTRRMKRTLHKKRKQSRRKQSRRKQSRRKQSRRKRN
jgi:hypothetical protein